MNQKSPSSTNANIEENVANQQDHDERVPASTADDNEIAESETQQGQVHPTVSTGSIKKTVDLFDLDSTTDADGSTLDIIQINNDEKSVIPFTSEVAAVSLHYCDMDEIRGYIHCNSNIEGSCALCQIGRTPAKFHLLPVFVPTDRRIALLRIGSSIRPRSLRPQIMDALKASLSDQKRRVLFIKKVDNVSFSVRVDPLPNDVDDGSKLVKQFNQQLETGTIDLTSAITRRSNETLSQVEGIADELRLRGIDGD